MVSELEPDISAELLGGDRLLTSEEVAAVLRIDPKSVTRKALAGEIKAIRIPGNGPWRFRESVIRAYLEGGEQ